MIIQGFVIATAAVLVLTFYILYAVNIAGEKDFLIELILIIIEITLLGMFAILGNIEYQLRRKV